MAVADLSSVDHSNLSSDMMDQLRLMQQDNTAIANNLDDQTQAITCFHDETSKSLRKLDDLYDTVQQLEGALTDLIQSSASDLHAHISLSTENIVEVVNAQATNIEQLAVVNQTMLLTEVALLRETQEAHTATIASLVSGLQHLKMTDQRAMVVNRLVSKPALLRNAMMTSQRMHRIETGLMPEPNSTHLTDLSPCQCRGHNRSRFWTSRAWFGQFAFLQREFFRHDPRCPLSMYDAQKSARSSGSARYRAQNAAIGLAFELSFAWHRGSGGFGISPWLSFQTVVDRDTSPSFQLIKCIGSILLPFGPYKLITSIADERQLIQVAIRKLQSVFTARKASPLDRNQYGQTLLFEFVFYCLPIVCIYIFCHKMTITDAGFSSMLAMQMSGT